MMMMNPKVSTKTPADCLKLLQDYLPADFGSLSESDIDVRVQQGGLINTIKLVTRKCDDFKVLIREYGGNVLDVEKVRSMRPPLSNQLLVFHELSNIGVGPKLLGVFDGGRIEEFIPSHTLAPQEFNDDEISKDIAINTAIIHNLKLPFNQTAPRRADMMIERCMKHKVDDYLNGLSEKYKEKIINCGADFETFKSVVDTDWLIEIENMKKILDKFDKRTGLILWDKNFLNVLVRDNPKPGQLKVCLIDFEFCRYENRAMDIACRFVNQLINFGGKGSDRYTGYKIAEEPKRRHFLREYLKECKRSDSFGQVNGHVNGHIAVEEKEVDQWLFEVDHYIAFILMHFAHMCLSSDFNLLDRDITWVVSTNN